MCFNYFINFYFEWKTSSRILKCKYIFNVMMLYFSLLRTFVLNICKYYYSIQLNVLKFKKEIHYAYVYLYPSMYVLAINSILICKNK